MKYAQPIVYSSYFYCAIVFAALTVVQPLLASQNSGGICIQKMEQLGAPQYTTSDAHLRGYALAKQVVISRGGSEWSEFKTDPRFKEHNSIKDNMESALAFIGIHEKSPYLEAIKKQQAHSSKPLQFFISWRRLGVRAMNLLISKRIAHIRLIEDVEIADGNLRDRKGFFNHDLVHAYQLALNIFDGLSKDKFSQFFFENFDYLAITRRFGASDHVLFDVGYYFYFHEAYYGEYFGSEISKIKDRENLKIEDVQQAYRNSSSQLVSFEFEGNKLSKAKLSPSVPRSGANNFISRFLDKNDYFDLLPPEIQSKIQESPHNSSKIIEDFLTDAFTVFYQQHYVTTLKLLALDFKPVSKKSP